MIVAVDEILIRKMQDSANDYELMAEWLSDDNILEFYQGRDNPSTIDQIIKKYRPRVTGKHRVTPCIIELSKSAIGYIQYYPIDTDEKAEYDYEANELIYGIDLFIGNTKYQNKGLGEKIIKSLISYLQLNIHPNKIIIDPRIDNKRAICCYEKCGFVTKKLLPKHELHEGTYHDNLLMELL